MVALELCRDPVPSRSGMEGTEQEPVVSSGQQCFEKAGGHPASFPTDRTLFKTFYLFPPHHTQKGLRVILTGDRGHGTSSFLFKKRVRFIISFFQLQK